MLRPQLAGSASIMVTMENAEDVADLLRRLMSARSLRLVSSPLTNELTTVSESTVTEWPAVADIEFRQPNDAVCEIEVRSATRGICFFIGMKLGESHTLTLIHRDNIVTLTQWADGTPQVFTFVLD